MSKLNLDRDKIDNCRELAQEIVKPIQKDIALYSTVAVERTVLRLLGVDGASDMPIAGSPDDKSQGMFPLVNLIVDKIGPKRIVRGAAYWLGRAMATNPKLKLLQVATGIASGKIDLDKLPIVTFEEVDGVIYKLACDQLQKIREKAVNRERTSKRMKLKKPLIYVIVATGNIHEDVIQAGAAARMGADIIAVIRSTAQSLLDYVPEGATTEGFGGTYATEENFKIMRAGLDEVGKELGRYIALTNYSSGLCMPEIAAMAANQGLDYLLNDSMYGILFRDINMQRTLIDQYYSRLICSFAGITIQTGEDNYLTTAESHRYWHQVLSSHFINEELAKQAGLSEDKIALGHAFEMDPTIEDSLLFEIAQAQLVREIFPRSPIKYMPPTKHKQGDIFFSHLYDGMFNLTGLITDQSIMLLGMPTEAIHNPFMQDRFMSLKNAKYLFNAAQNIGSEVQFQANGRLVRRARHVLDESLQMLHKVKLLGLVGAIEKGMFGNISRSRVGGKGLEGVFEKDENYYNPLLELLGSNLSNERRRAPYEQRDTRRPRYNNNDNRNDNRDSRTRPERRPAANRGDRENNPNYKRRNLEEETPTVASPAVAPTVVSPQVVTPGAKVSEAPKRQAVKGVVYRPPKKDATPKVAAEVKANSDDDFEIDIEPLQRRTQGHQLDQTQADEAYVTEQAVAAVEHDNETSNDDGN